MPYGKSAQSGRFFPCGRVVARFALAMQRHSETFRSEYAWQSASVGCPSKFPSQGGTIQRHFARSGAIDRRIERCDRNFAAELLGTASCSTCSCVQESTVAVLKR